LVRELEPSARSIKNWVPEADLDEDRRADGLTTKERKNLGALRRKNERLKKEPEILAIAAA